MSNYQIFFHVGYPKAASTSLQLNLFSCHSEIHDLSKSIKERKRKLQENFYKSLKSNYFSVEANYDIFSYLSTEKINVFSHENMVDEFDNEFVNKELRANRIKTLFPNAKIIMIIRQQNELLRSLYDFWTVKPQNNINLWLKDLFDNKHQNPHYLSCLEFDKVIKLYQSLFGRDNVKILIFEELKFNPINFGHELSDFMNISEEETIYNLSKKPLNTYNSEFHKYHILRKKILPNVKLNQYLPDFLLKTTKRSILNFLKQIKTQKSNISENNIALIKNYYKQSNQNCIKLTGLDLDKYNYPLP